MDHPRIRGTNWCFFRHNLNPQGSSPHTRDKSFMFSEKKKQNGIIPAYAGQIIQTLYDLCVLRDHPRIRGTNSYPGAVYIEKSGSSPHTRDKYCERVGGVIRLRIIPAYAGQIALTSAGRLRRQDHPRIRGTNHIR